MLLTKTLMMWSAEAMRRHECYVAESGNRCGSVDSAVWGSTAKSQ